MCREERYRFRPSNRAWFSELLRCIGRRSQMLEGQELTYVVLSVAFLNLIEHVWMQSKWRELTLSEYIR
jgi:hypothetical protein